MDVYGVEKGAAWDGSSIVGVYDSEEKARTKMGAMMLGWPQIRNKDDDEVEDAREIHWNDRDCVILERHALQ